MALLREASGGGVRLPPMIPGHIVAFMSGQSGTSPGEAAPWFETPPKGVEIEDAYWSPRLELNRKRAILYQWEQYQRYGTIDNFRILAGTKKGERRGFFYADSDLHKWADAASRILRAGPDTSIEGLLREYVTLMASCQEPDGYLFTYNQLHFPGTRWKNLQIEHELYCHGHFIEAGVSHFEATGRRDLIDLAEKSARLIVREFKDAGPERTSGHEEVEIALLRLYGIAGDVEYLETARNLLERRGRIKGFGAKLLRQVLSQVARSKAADRQKSEKGQLGFEMGENLTKREPPFLLLRALPCFLSGAYQQQDRPMRKQIEPKGHAVRWTYLMAAAARLHRESPDASLLHWMRSAWDRLVEEKMYVTGGIGSLPILEGFGRPFELDNRYSYSETCAAIGSILWNRELSLATGEARYADLIEWQLQNAASVGIALSGDRYFYRNPLSADGELERRPWYATACCPSNISRLWAEVPRLIFARSEGLIRIDQYIGSSARFDADVSVRMKSALPWEGLVRIEVESASPITVLLRMPCWAGKAKMTLRGTSPRTIERLVEQRFGKARFDRAEYLACELGSGKSEISLDFSMEISLLRAHPLVRADVGRVVVTRGPLVYCAETVDNPGLDLDAVSLDAASLHYRWAEGLFGVGCGTISGSTSEGLPLSVHPVRFLGKSGARFDASLDSTLN